MYKYEEKYVRKGMLVKKVSVLKPSVLEGEKAKKEYEKNTLVVEIDGIPFNTDKDSINYLGSVVALANKNVLELMASGKEPSEAYNTIYKDMKLKWKCADNVVREITVETLSNVLRQGLLETEKIIGVS